MAGQIRVRASLRLVKEDKLFGPGAAQLLAGVDELGSLRDLWGHMACLPV